MIYLYLVYILYIIFAAVYIGAACRRGSDEQPKIKIWVSVSYLTLAVLMYLLNTVDGKPVAGEHFAWIFSAMALMFIGDMIAFNGPGYREPIAARIFFFIAYGTMLCYLTHYLHGTALYWVSVREDIIIAAGVLFTAVFVFFKREAMGKQKAIIILCLVAGFAATAKASSLIEFMNTNVSWPTFIGILFFLISDILFLCDRYGKNGSVFIRGAAMTLYYAGMAALPFGIYYV